MRAHSRQRLTATILSLGVLVLAAAGAAAHEVPAGGVAVLGPAPRAAGGAPEELLPDLQQTVPKEITTRRLMGSSPPRYLLGFASAIENAGTGPLVVEGFRASSAAPMPAEQRVSWSDGTTTTQPGAGEFRFVESSDHRHWHLLDASRYELRMESGALVGRDEKTGFCLGDRYESAFFSELAGEPLGPVFRGKCHPGDTDRLDTRQGISVGYGDNYAAYLEGQSVELTGVPAGRYVLVHRADPKGLLREVRTDNNASSALIDLAWPQGADAMPGVSVVARCRGAERCEPSAATGHQEPETSTPAVTVPPVPAMPRDSAGRFARRAIGRHFSRPKRSLRSTCRRRSATRFSCALRWRSGRLTYAGPVSVRWETLRDQMRWRYAMRLVRTGGRCMPSKRPACRRVIEVPVRVGGTAVRPDGS